MKIQQLYPLFKLMMKIMSMLYQVCYIVVIGSFGKNSLIMRKLKIIKLLLQLKIPVSTINAFGTNTIYIHLLHQDINTVFYAHLVLVQMQISSTKMEQN